MLIQNEDYVRTACAKGVCRCASSILGTMRNAPLAGVDDHRAADRLAAVRSRPHRNRLRLARDRHLAEDAIFNRDYLVLQGGILFVAAVFVLVNLLVDISYAVINPRIRGPLMSVAELESREIELDAPSGGLRSDASTRLRRNPGALVGFALVALFVVVAVFAPLIAPYGPREQNLALLSEGCCPGPSADHWFGVDQLAGTSSRGSFMGALLARDRGGRRVGWPLARPAARLAGGLHRRCRLGRHAPDGHHARDPRLVVRTAVAVLGPGLWQVMVAVGVVTIPIFARLLRGSVLAQKENDFVLAARAVGVPRRTIVFSHILPNAISPVIVAATLAMATAIIDVAGLGFPAWVPRIRRRRNGARC